MKAICLNIIDYEEKTRKKLKGSNLLEIKDNIYHYFYHSFVSLKYAKILKGIDLNV